MTLQMNPHLTPMTLQMGTSMIPQTDDVRG
jgi:hypothetical protein